MTARFIHIWWLRWDLLSAKVLAWAPTFGRDVELSSETHAFFYDRYHRLAEHHRVRGRLSRARRLNAKADEHYRAGGFDGPPYAAAMAMPRPDSFTRVDAVGRYPVHGPDDAA
jgi:YD repeat-containing protein